MLLYKFGWKNFWKRPLQNIISLLLIVAAFTFTGLYIVTLSFDSSDLEKKCYFSKEIKYDSNFNKSNFMQFIYGNQLTMGSTITEMPYSNAKALTDELHSLGQGYSVDFGFFKNRYVSWEGSAEPYFGLHDIYDYIAKEDKIKANALYNSEGEIAPYIKYIVKTYDDGTQPQTAGRGFFLLYKNISVAYDMDEKSLEAYGYTLYGKFPEDTYDITIPWYLYKSFESYGYKNGADGEKIEINSPEDIIGKELLLGDSLSSSAHAATVVGVLNPNQDLSDYLDVERITEEDIIGGDFIERNYGYTPAFSIYVSEEYYKSQVTEEAYCTSVSVCRNSSEKLRDAYWEIGGRYKQGKTEWEIYTDTSLHVETDLCVAFNVHNANYGFAFLTSEMPFNNMAYWAIPFSIVLSAFLLTFGLSHSKRQFSTLRSLGAKKKNLFLAYFLPEVIFMLGAVIISFVGTMISSYCLSLWSFSFILEQFNISFTPLNLMNGTAALTLGLSGLAALVVCAALLWINVHAMRFDRVDKKNRKRIKG